MSQNQQYQKVKLYRALKIVFYMLGLPLFMVAVCFTTVKFLGHDPFMGDTATTSALGFFMQIESYVTAPALYGVWIAFALWAIISIVHIILAKTVKSSRVRMFAVVATCLVVMLVAGFVMDAAFESQIEQIAADAKKSYGDGVTVADYKTQLSYYRNLSSNAFKKNETNNLIEKIDLLKKAYNVGMEGQDKGGVAGNISNKPVTYGYLISDEKDGMVEVGVDISFKTDETTGASKVNVDKNNNIEAGDGLITDVERNQIVELKPIDGKLVINGVTYSNYWYKEKGYKTVQYDTKKGKWVTVTPNKKKNDQFVYVWYSKDLMPVGTVYVDEKGKELPEGAAGGTVSVVNTTEGDFGTGIYNPNGLFSDGWVFSLYNVLEILEDYYESQALVTSGDYKDEVAMIIQNAIDARDAYYTTEASARETAYYEQEVYFTDRFSLTHGRLDYLVAQVGALLGDNHLFDLLLDKNASGDYGASEILKDLAEKIPLINEFEVNFDGQKTTIAKIIAPILTKLEKGWSLKDMGVDMNKTVSSTTIGGLIKAAAGITGEYELKNASLVLVYKGEIFGQKKDHLYIALVRSDEAGNMGTNPAKATEGGDVLLDIDFDNTLLGEDDYAFDLDHLSQFLNTAIDGIVKMFGVDLCKYIVDDFLPKTVIGLFVKDMTVDGVNYKGLSISGINIPLLRYTTYTVDNKTHYNFYAAVDITAILVNVLQGLYSYQSPLIKPFWEFIDPEMGEVDAAVKKFYKAQYEAQTYGKMIGSILVGDTLGAGTYPSALGLTDLNSVRQVKVDLSYKPNMYPLFSLRDMIMFFTGLVVFFYFLSFVCAEKEREYANGTAVVEERKKRNKKKGKDVLQDENAVQDADTANAIDPLSTEDTALPAEENTQKEVE